MVGKLEPRAFITKTRLAMHLLFKANKNLWDRKIAKMVFLLNGFQLSTSLWVQGLSLEFSSQIKTGYCLRLC